MVIGFWILDWGFWIGGDCVALGWRDAGGSISGRAMMASLLAGGVTGAEILDWASRVFVCAGAGVAGVETSLGTGSATGEDSSFSELRESEPFLLPME